MAAWVLGCGAALLVWRYRWKRIEAALQSARPLLEGPEYEALQRVTTSPVKLVSSPTSLEPGVFGVFRPVIMLPAGIADRLTTDQLEAILAHEACHIRHRDNAGAALHMLVEALFWFHPLVWWLGSRLVQEREQACDEDVLRLGKEPQVYAEGILQVCRFYLESPLRCAAGISRTNLTQRVKDIMGSRGRTSLSAGRKLLLASAGAAALSGPIVFGMIDSRPVSSERFEPSNRPAFASATITVSQGSSRHSLKIFPDRVEIENITLRELIDFAYDVALHQITGPEWLESARYNIHAQTAGPVTLAQLRRMSQNLLEQRVKLATHREQREGLVYVLTTDPNGPKLIAASGGHEKFFRVFHDGLEFRNISIPELAGRLSDLPAIGSPVVDRTGIQGVFNISMHGGLQAIPAMLNAQLGLKMTLKREPVEMLVVDHAEKISERNEL